jgi:hypothetical protein
MDFRMKIDSGLDDWQKEDFSEKKISVFNLFCQIFYL